MHQYVRAQSVIKNSRNLVFYIKCITFFKWHRLVWTKKTRPIIFLLYYLYFPSIWSWNCWHIMVSSKWIKNNYQFGKLWGLKLYTTRSWQSRQKLVSSRTSFGLMIYMYGSGEESSPWYTYHPLGCERLYLPLYKVAYTPFTFKGTVYIRRVSANGGRHLDFLPSITNVYRSHNTAVTPLWIQGAN